MSEINPARWERARDIDFRDLVEEITGQSGKMISCPFHGSDRTPSFEIYPHRNNGWCFGCPPGEQLYDTISFVAKTYSFSPTKALLWLEKHYNLPNIDPESADIDDEEEEIVELTVEDMQEAYIRQAARDVQRHQDVEMAMTYLQRRYEAMTENDPVKMARLLDPDTLEALKKKKLGI